MQTHKKVAILGYGLEGQSLKRYLKSAPEYKNSPVAVLDKKYDSNYLKRLGRFDLIFRSPGIPYLTKEIQSAKRDGAEISSATKLFFQKCPCPIIGVTGSKGKGTAATLIYRILKAAKKDAYLVGNIGTPVLDVLPRLKKGSWVVFELSSFQLQDLAQSPRIAVILGITPEHLDHHKTLKEYLDAKSSISKFQKSKNITLFYRDNPGSKKIGQLSKGEKIPFSLKDSNHILLGIKKNLRLPGEHNLLNAYAASRAAHLLGIPQKTIFEAIKGFRGLPYRVQKIRSNPNVYNDSASTNPEATAAAIKAVDPTILIMGGQNKKLSYKILRLVIKKSRIEKIYLYGANKKEISNAFRGLRAAKLFPDLKKLARAIKKIIRPEDVILFSPGSTSLDQFKNYQERGGVFNRLVKKLD